MGGFVDHAIETMNDKAAAIAEYQAHIEACSRHKRRHTMCKGKLAIKQIAQNAILYINSSRSSFPNVASIKGSAAGNGESGNVPLTTSLAQECPGRYS